MLGDFKPLFFGSHPNLIFQCIVSLSAYYHLLQTHINLVILIAVFLLVHFNYVVCFADCNDFNPHLNT